jgi:hypothetical protein
MEIIHFTATPDSEYGEIYITMINMVIERQETLNEQISSFLSRTRVIWLSEKTMLTWPTDARSHTNERQQEAANADSHIKTSAEYDVDARSKPQLATQSQLLQIQGDIVEQSA